MTNNNANDGKNSHYDRLEQGIEASAILMPHRESGGITQRTPWKSEPALPIHADVGSKAADERYVNVAVPAVYGMEYLIVLTKHDIAPRNKNRINR